MADEIAPFGEYVEDIEGFGQGGAGHEGSPMMESLKGSAHRAADRAHEYAREHPERTATIAAICGAVAGAAIVYLFKRR